MVAVVAAAVVVVVVVVVSWVLNFHEISYQQLYSYLRTLKTVTSPRKFCSVL